MTSGKLLLTYIIELCVGLFLTTSVYSQNITISGTTKELSGNTLPGVNIIQKGTVNGTASDIDGKFTIKLSSREAVLVFTYLGFETTEITVGDKNFIEVVLNEEVKAINEVVVIGYGIQKKSDITGSVAVISSKDLQNRPVGDATQAMQGKLAGVTITQNSGAPGSDATVRIRGVGTVNNSDPLFVVDGVPVSNTSFLNPSDIESISVLKDASSSAIYGSRGANGVILITTKKGTEGKSTINFNMYSGIQNIYKKIDMLNTTQWGNVVNQTLKYDDPNNPDLIKNPDTLPIQSNFQDEIMRTGKISDYNLSISGGDKATVYSISGGLFSQTGLVKISDSQTR
jgi:TonB-linked SusC/RagA family outer membrane protein